MSSTKEHKMCNFVKNGRNVRVAFKYVAYALYNVSSTFWDLIHFVEKVTFGTYVCTYCKSY
jgi:hypothetical protein